MQANATTWALFAGAVLVEVIGTSALQRSQGFTQFWPSVTVVLCYGAAFYFLSLTLSVLPIGPAYAMWSGLGIVLISAVGWLWLKQSLDLPALIGIALILSGVLVINLFSTTVAH